MAVTPSYRDYVADQIGALGQVVIKRMFGGMGLWFEGRMFGLIDDDVVFLRVDDATRPAFVARGMLPFRPVRSKSNMVSLNYYQLPGEVLDDSDELVVWARRAITASQSPTAAVAKRARKRTKPKKTR